MLGNPKRKPLISLISLILNHSHLFSDYLEERLEHSSFSENQWYL